MGKQDYRLFNWKEDPFGKRTVYDWHGEELNESELNKLRVGDCVRLILMDVEPGQGWEKIYFEITKINYYKKGSAHIPRTYFGKAMDTYRTDEVLRYLQTGDVISFQKNNIYEIPRWTADTPLEQRNAGKIDKDIHYLEQFKTKKDQQAEFRIDVTSYSQNE